MYQIKWELIRHCLFRKTFQAEADADIGPIVQYGQSASPAPPSPPPRRERDAAIYVTISNTGHNREETRTIAMFDSANPITDPDRHACITAIIPAEWRVHTRNAGYGTSRPTPRAISPTNPSPPPGSSMPFGRTGLLRTPSVTAETSPWAELPKVPAAVTDGIAT